MWLCSLVALPEPHGVDLLYYLYLYLYVDHQGALQKQLTTVTAYRYTYCQKQFFVTKNRDYVGIWNTKLGNKFVFLLAFIGLQGSIFVNSRSQELETNLAPTKHWVQKLERPESTKKVWDKAALLCNVFTNTDISFEWTKFLGIFT